MAVFDLDGTITRFDTYLPFLSYICSRRPGRALKSLTLPPAVLSYLRGQQDNSWLKERFWNAFAGRLNAADVGYWGSNFAELIFRHGLRPGALRKIEEHRRSGDHLILVSASFDLYVAALGQRLGFDSVLCTRAEISAENRVTGRLDGLNCYGAEKVTRLQSYLADRPDFSSRIAYSDHHSDIDLFRWADSGVAVHPTSRLKQEAEKLALVVVTDWS